MRSLSEFSETINRLNIFSRQAGEVALTREKMKRFGRFVLVALVAVAIALGVGILQAGGWDIAVRSLIKVFEIAEILVQQGS
ncbi:MAG: hypothetical protein AAF609_20125 [Cyanobacteria bacterium P01_C01_bin.120]